MPNEFALFYEQSPGHSFLYEVYADAVPSRLIVPPTNPWDGSPQGLRAGIASLEAALLEARELDVPLVLLTLDPFFHAAYRQVLSRAASLTSRPIVGIYHRYGGWSKDDIGFAGFTAKLRVCVLAAEIAERARARGLAFEVLPLHPAIANVPPRPGRARSSDRLTVSLLGELREGKGLDLVLDTLPLLGPSLRRQLHLRFGGKADAATRARVEASVAAAGTSAEIHLRDGGDFDVLSAIEFADLCYGTDIGLLLYQDAQRSVMSGVLPNFVHTGAVTIATADSVVGAAVERHRLGPVIDDESPVALHDAIARLASPAERHRFVGSREYAAYRTLIGVDNVKRTLRRLLDLPESPLA